MSMKSRLDKLESEAPGPGYCPFAFAIIMGDPMSFEGETMPVREFERRRQRHWAEGCEKCEAARRRHSITGINFNLWKSEDEML